MLEAIIVLGGLGLLAGVGLAIASKVFYVYVDPKIAEIEEVLPGANCGGCGFPGCSAAAEAIATGKAPPNICVGGGPAVHAKVAEILGVEVKEVEPQIARLGCYYGVKDADLKYHYDGLNDCRAAVLLSGGPKNCPIGCIGLGSCVKACPFGALSMGKDGLPTVNPEICTGCGTCERICPKHIITLTSNSSRILHEYTTDECTAPCQRACPAGIDIPAYIHEIANGNYLEAVRIIKEKNPLPLVCGRICVHPCEYECRRNLVDEPVAINYLKRFAADYEMKSGRRVELSKAPATGYRVAVIGGGAEGLTVAAFLARLGHEPTIYEAMPKLGGLLRTIIPDSRLPKDVLDWEIQGILELGVKALTSKKLGRDFTIAALLHENFDAIFVATGGWDTQMASRMVKDTEEVLPGVRLLASFTLEWFARKTPKVGKNVMIIGAGNASLEAARIVKELGAEMVHILFRGKAEDVPFTQDQIKRAEADSIYPHFESALVKMVGVENRLTCVQIANVTGPPKPIDVKSLSQSNAIEEIPVDMVLIGAGRFPELIYIPSMEEKVSEDSEVSSSKEIRWETLLPYAGPFAEHDIGIFRPGEATTDYKAVVEAIGSGRRAAISIHKYLMGEAIEPPPNMIRHRTTLLSVEEVEHVSPAPRQPMAQLSWEEQLENPKAEIELGYTEEQALKEARRCLRCGLICYRREEPHQRLARSA